MNKESSIAARSRLAVTYRAVGDLIPDPRNARTHPKRQIDQLKASIAAFGFTNPILADPEGHIIAGHGRLQAARAMGLAEVPTITLSGLSETQKRALRIADNKIALNAGWDLEILKLELSPTSAVSRIENFFRAVLRLWQRDGGRMGAFADGTDAGVLAMRV
jgi:hypothetical protein